LDGHRDVSDQQLHAVFLPPGHIVTQIDQRQVYFVGWERALIIDGQRSGVFRQQRDHPSVHYTAPIGLDRPRYRRRWVLDSVTDAGSTNRWADGGGHPTRWQKSSAIRSALLLGTVTGTNSSPPTVVNTHPPADRSVIATM
jgi:hypothetical protein